MTALLSLDGLCQTYVNRPDLAERAEDVHALVRFDAPEGSRKRLHGLLALNHFVAGRRVATRYVIKPFRIVTGKRALGEKQHGHGDGQSVCFSNHSPAI